MKNTYKAKTIFSLNPSTEVITDNTKVSVPKKI